MTFCLPVMIQLRDFSDTIATADLFGGPIELERVRQRKGHDQATDVGAGILIDLSRGWICSHVQNDGEPSNEAGQFADAGVKPIREPG